MGPPKILVWLDASPQYYPLLDPYEKFLAIQNALWDERTVDIIPDTLVLTHHRPTITCGARPLKSQVPHVRPIPSAWHAFPDEELFEKTREFLRANHGIDFVRTNRGGSLWYHDDGVLQLYLIAETLPGAVIALSHIFEQILFQTVQQFGLSPHYIEHDATIQSHRYIGVWVRGKKIGAIGLRGELHPEGKKMITKFGAALNVHPNPKNLLLINPCGIEGRDATSLELELHTRIMIRDVARIVLQEFNAVWE